jgi:hydrogenase large subunit
VALAARSQREILHQAHGTARRSGFQRDRVGARRACDWIKIANGKIANYQVITPTAWNIGPRDAKGNNGPIGQAMIGTTVEDNEDPIELGVIARSYDSCLVYRTGAFV